MGLGDGGATLHKRRALWITRDVVSAGMSSDVTAWELRSVQELSSKIETNLCMKLFYPDSVEPLSNSDPSPGANIPAWHLRHEPRLEPSTEAMAGFTSLFSTAGYVIPQLNRLPPIRLKTVLIPT